MNKTALDINTAARRLQILRALAIRPRFVAETRNLRQELEVTGYPMAFSKLAVECAFLADMGLLESPGDGLISLTDDGLSVANGLIRLPGIGTPEPGAL